MVISDNLQEVSQNFFAPDMLQKLSDSLGQSVEKTKTGLKSVIPALMSGIVDKGSTPEGAATLVDMVNTHNFDSTPNPDANRVSEGSDVVNNIFGSNLNNVVSRLGVTTGLGSSSITKMMGLVAPAIMGFLGTKVKNEKLGSMGLMNFLSSQKGILSGLGTGVSTFSNMATEKAEVIGHATQEIPWRKIGLAALVLLGLWFWWLGAHKKVATPILSRATNIQKVVTQAVLPSVGELGNFLARGSELELPKHFRFESLTFATGAARLGGGSEMELDKIAKALSANPMAKARIEGYTDNLGSAESNQILSAQRASAVRNQLIARGIDARRIEAVGMGSLNPIADNATAEGRAMNRRIDFVVTQLK